MYTLRLLVTAIVAAVFVGVAAAQHPTQAPSSYMGPSAETPLPGFGPSAPGPTSNDCMTLLFNMSDCLTFAQEGSNLTVPDKNCCPELAGLVESNATCLCQLLAGKGLKDYGIDLARALKLPSICGVSTPPVSMCSAFGYPVAAPTPSEMSMAPGTPSSYMGPSAETPSPGFGPSAPGPTSNDCITKLFNMSDCLSFVEEGSNSTVPDKNCCPELAGLVESDPICLCQLLGQGAKSYGISIDLAKALKLPSICGVSTPPVSTCSALGYPVAAPTPSEMSTPPAGSAPIPSTGDSKSEASSIAGSSVALFLGLAFAAYLLLTFF